MILTWNVMANLEQSSRIPNAESVKITFSLIVTFYLTKLENKTKKISNTALTLLLWLQKMPTSAKLREPLH